jgi:hypothetical protein
MKLLFAILVICVGVAATTRAEAKIIRGAPTIPPAAAVEPIVASRHSSSASTMCAGLAAFVIAIRNINRRPDRIRRSHKATILRKPFAKPRVERTNGTKEGVRFPASAFEPV